MTPVDGDRTVSGLPVAAIYGPEDVPPAHRERLDAPAGVPPFLRGAYPEMYRSRPWRIFQLSGFGDPEDERERIKFLLAHGETGFLMEHDRNTADHLYDVDHPDVVARREDVGLTGAVIQSIRDYETVLDGIPIEGLYAHPGGAVVQHAPFALASYWTVARRRGHDLRRLSGTGQSDYFLTYLGCPPKQQVPTDAGLRFNLDIVEFCAEHLPRWVPVSIAAYNAADTGLNAWQELGALFANAVEYLDGLRDRGRTDLARAARGVGGVNFRVGMDLFEDIAKLRAARVMWHDLLARRYGITDPRAAQLRIHIVTAGSAMTYQQPLNNIVRGTLMGLAAVLGGTQSLGVSGYDEAISVPAEHAHQMSVRIQQILQEETGVMRVVDPLGGSWYVESLTAELMERAWGFYEEIEQQGGFLSALDDGWLHQQAIENQVAWARSLEDGSRTIVGVTDHVEDSSPFVVDGFEADPGVWDRASARLADLRRSRDGRRATDALRALEDTCRGTDNLMPAMLEAVDAEVSLGEIGDVFRSVFGDWDVPIDV